MSELKVNRATVIEWLDANEIEVTHTQLAGLFASAIEAAPAQVVPARRSSMSEWFDSENNIIVDTLPELMSAANTRQFGETKAETLTRFLMCEAFERRYAPEEARAFRLAAMIISRIETQPAAQDAPVDAAVKPAINVGTIGHVGSGKTTLIAALGKLIAAQKGNHD